LIIKEGKPNNKDKKKSYNGKKDVIIKLDIIKRRVRNKKVMKDKE
jgi:hypothetical protein